MRRVLPMSQEDLQKHNIKEIRTMKDGVLFIIDKSSHEWVLKGNILFHMDNKRCDGKAHYHKQREVANLTHAIKYIAGHSHRLTKLHKKQCKMERLFAMI
ncbi:MAG: hypothetical protein ACRDD7_01440 [Peptostreptococcaceae bacterium]